MQNTDLNLNTNAAAPRFAIGENVAPHYGSCVYAVLFSDGWIKVGRGKNGAGRIGSHAGLSTMRNATIVSSVISGRLVDSRSAENQLINYCTARGTPVHGREWFSGVEFDELGEIIQTRFSGDSAEKFQAAHEQADADAGALVDKIFSLGSSCYREAEPRASDNEKWAETMAYARILNRIYIDDLYQGELFEVNRAGITNFILYASIAIHEMDDGQIADLFCRAANNPGETLESLMADADALFEAFRAKVAA